MELVPVLDGRRKHIKVPKGLRTIISDLPQYDGPVLTDSVVLVCYTNGGFISQRTSEFNMGHNLIWAVVLEAPEFDWYVSP